MNYPSHYGPKPTTTRPTEADKSLERAKAEIEGQRKALKERIK